MQIHTPYSGFNQDSPRLINEYLNDKFLLDYLKVYLPRNILEEISPDLSRFGKRAATELVDYASACESNPPQLISYNAWGERVDEIRVAPEWKKFRDIAAEEGLVAIGYERKYAEFSRLYQFVKLYLFTPSSAMYACPLAMSDGAARLIEHFGDNFLKANSFRGLISRDAKKFLTSGQWMTERTGGSDVSRSMTLAYYENGSYVLRGHKWFTSAILADMAFTLASTEQPQDGKRAPLSLFYMPIRNEDGSLNGIQIEALKDKLGTRALPTAQLLLTGAKARLVSEKGKGVKTISTLFNVTRIYNTMTAVSYMRRAFAMSEAYGNIRETFGKKINKHILFQKSLTELKMTYESNFLLGFFLIRLLGKEDCKKASQNEIAVLRLLTPVAKLYTAKWAISSASEYIEMFGGLGYLEDTNVPWLLRDAQVLSIWEGTTNVLSLDMLRAIEKENGLKEYHFFAENLLESITSSELEYPKSLLNRKLKGLYDFLSKISSSEEMEGNARDIAFYFAELTIGLLWLDFVQKNPDEEYLGAMNYWLRFRVREETLGSYKMITGNVAIKK
ncbi:MAG: acyl-CoA dehydrogenase family protein [Chitinophagaceae bacterium]|nr:acyl-CoA dehydrogenase family protein [Chitinophagaceae bacterium]